MAQLPAAYGIEIAIQIGVRVLSTTLMAFQRKYFIPLVLLN
jgi:hypothetical protein